jgi:hypothetical protein
MDQDPMRYIETMKGEAMYEDSILPCDWLIEGPRGSCIAKMKVLNYLNILDIPNILGILDILVVSPYFFLHSPSISAPF